jgi:hypothetical protein
MRGLGVRHRATPSNWIGAVDRRPALPSALAHGAFATVSAQEQLFGGALTCGFGAGGRNEPTAFNEFDQIAGGMLGEATGAAPSGTRRVQSSGSCSQPDAGPSTVPPTTPRAVAQ